MSYITTLSHPPSHYSPGQPCSLHFPFRLDLRPHLHSPPITPQRLLNSLVKLVNQCFASILIIMFDNLALALLFPPTIPPPVILPSSITQMPCLHLPPQTLDSTTHLSSSSFRSFWLRKHTLTVLDLIRLYKSHFCSTTDWTCWDWFYLLLGYR